MYARISALLVAMALAVTSAAFAQEIGGTLSGRVLDAQKPPVPGVTVTATGPQGARTAVSDGDGRFQLPFLTPGSYDIRTELQGFKSFEQKAVTVSLGKSVDLPIKLEVGGLTETVNVTGAVPTLDTRSTTIGAVLDTQALQNIPIGRRFSDTLY